MIKKLASMLIIALLIAIPLTPTAHAAESPGDVATRITASVVERINAAPHLELNEGLGRVAAACARIVAGFSADSRRAFDFQTLPNGQRIYSLVAEQGLAVRGFNYSIFFGDFADWIENTYEFTSKISNPHFAHAGVAVYIAGDGMPITVIVYSRTMYGWG